MKECLNFIVYKKIDIGPITINALKIAQYARVNFIAESFARNCIIVL